MDDSRQCTATAKSTGERCKRAAIKGGNVCPVHGGAAEQVQKKAAERLDEMADSVAAEMQERLTEIFERMDDPELSDEEYVALHREARQLATNLWDRTGNGPSETTELTGEEGGPLELNITRTVVDDDGN